MMQKFIAFLLRKFTPFRVIAWDGKRISDIGYYPVPNQQCHQALIEDLSEKFSKAFQEQKK